MNALGGYDFEDLSLGMTATFGKTITEADIVLFAAVSGDNNAVHINEEFAKTTQFGGRIAHGMLSAALISAVIGGPLCTLQRFDLRTGAQGTKGRSRVP